MNLLWEERKKRGERKRDGNVDQTWKRTRCSISNRAGGELLHNIP